MSRWLIDEYSDDDDEQQSELLLEKTKEQEKSTSLNGTIINNIQNLFSKLDKCLDFILECMIQNHFNKAHEKFIKLQKFYKKNKKVFKKYGNPHFLIRKLYSINHLMQEIAQKNKFVWKFEKDIKKFNKEFEIELTEIEKNPEKFANDDDQINDENQIDEKNNNEWFI